MERFEGMERKRARVEKLKWTVAVCAYIVMIFLLATYPGTSRPDAVPNGFWEMLRNALHVPLYAGLAWLLMQAAREENLTLFMPTIVTVLLMAMTVAFADEWIQSRSPGRNASLLDIGLDLLGILLVIMPPWGRWARRRISGAVPTDC
jgi:VanZ family protein